MALLAPKVPQGNEESWAKKYATRDATVITSKETAVLFFVRVCGVCYRVSGVKRGRMVHLDLQDFEGKWDLQ